MFPKNNKEIVEKVRVAIKEQFNVDVEVLAFGDGAFKDPSSNLGVSRSIVVRKLILHAYKIAK